MPTSIDELSARIEALEKQVAELIERLQEKPDGQHSFKDLRGCMRGMFNMSEEEIAACEVKLELGELLPSE